ncbi:MAG: tetratricopeptide repeat protein [Candidatus Cloacimonetes bacterium]|nr:tetratricopeptide repeat protein [Candidatus Cloacimonadota bacterium]
MIDQTKKEKVLRENPFSKLAETYSRLGNYNKTLEYYLKALQIKDQDDSEKIDILYNLGIVSSNLSEYTQALEYNDQALSLCKMVDHKPKIAAIYNNIGVIYQNLSNYDKALSNFLDSLQIYEYLKQIEGQASALNNIGNIYRFLSNYENALENYQKSLKLNTDISNDFGIANTLNNIGVIFYDQKKYPEALKYFNNSLEKHKENGDKKGIAALFNNIGDVYADQKLFQDALKNFLKSLEYEEEINDKFGIAVCSKNVGNLYLKLNDLKKAESFLSKGKEIAEIIKANELSMEIYLALSELSEEKQDYQKALDFFVRSSQIKDQIFSEKNSKKISELRTKFETEKKEKEAEIYRLQNVDLVNANTNLKDEIKERKKTEEALRISEERFRSIFENAEEFILIMDKNWQIVQVNPATIKRTAYGKEELTDKYFYDFLKSDLKENSKIIKNALSQKNNINTEIEFITKNDEIIIMDCDISAIKNKNGKIISIVSFQRDITQKKEIEKMKTEFVSLVSHELRSPIASIKGFTSTILDDEDMDDQTKKEFLTIIDNESDRLSRLINNLLDISRIESGKVGINIHKGCINTVILQAISNLKPLAVEKKLEIKFIPDECIPDFSFDHDKILQVFLNLLSNSIKFTATSGYVDISYHNEKDKISISIKDNGIGIPATNLDRIFDKFYRVENSDIKVRGTGLGLSIVKEIVKSHKGNISVESEVGKGSIFTIVLPVNI